MTRLFRVALAAAALSLASVAPLATQAPQADDDSRLLDPLPLDPLPPDVLPPDALPPDALMRLGSPRWRVPGLPFCGEFSPDGKRFAVIGRDYVPRLWDAHTGRELRAFFGENTPCLAFSPDGGTLALTRWNPQTEERRVRLVDLTTYKVVREFAIGGDPNRQVTSLAFSPDGRTLVTGTDGYPARERRRGSPSPEVKCVVQRWDVATGKLLWRSPLVGDTAVRLAFAPGGRHLAVGTPAHLVLLDPYTGRVRFQRQCLHGAFTFDAAGAILGYRRNHKATECEQLDVNTGTALQVHRVPHGLAAAGPGGRLLAVTAKGPRDLWDVAAGKQLATLAGLPPAEAQDDLNNPKVLPLAVSPDGTTLAVAVGGNENAPEWGTRSVLLFDIATGQERRGPLGHRAGVSQLSVSADGKTLATAGADAAVCLWDLGSGQLQRRLDTHDRRVAVDLSPDGRLLAVAADKRVLVWDTAAGQELRRWEEPAAQVSGKAIEHVRFTPDGKTLVLGMGYAWGSVWDVEGGRRRVLFQDVKYHYPAAMALSPDGRLAATACGIRMCLWDVATGTKVVQYFSKFHKSSAHTVAFSPDGETLALGLTSEVGLASVDDLKERKVARSIPTGSVNALAFAPDGKTLATATGTSYRGPGQNLVQLWDVATGKEIRRFAGHRDAVTAVAFTPDGAAVVSGSADNTILVWSVRGTGKAPKQEAQP
jgi:WD40 repeat protein